MRIHVPLLQASKNVLLIKISHQAPFCSCCRERKDERDTYKEPFFPLFLDRGLKREWWVRWLPSFCWCSYRHLLRISAKYRLSLIESSTVAQAIFGLSVSGMNNVPGFWGRMTLVLILYKVTVACYWALSASSITSDGAGPISEGQWHIHLHI